ncbi:MAG TPA: LacI family DNA-binding transcriptional regulator [bacterium]|nr:LacI family DNA-binding transcriptional regulator [bacterium]
MAITIKDVALKAGVSVATVSRVVNQKDIHKVGQKTQQRIETILKELGYYPNTMARGLKTRKTYNIGVVFFWNEKPSLNDAYLASVLDGILGFVGEKQYSILMNTFSRNNQNNGVYTNFVNSGLVDGILAIAPPVESHLVQDLKQGTLPYVLINYQLNDKGACFVDCFNTQGIIDLVDHLVSLGHKKIAFISGDHEGSKNFMDRYNAYKYIMKKRGITYRDDFVYFGNATEEAGMKGAEAFLKLKNQPTAIIGANDRMAIGAIKELRRKGLKVPDDMAVCGFDDFPSEFGLTTVHQPTYQMGYEAARMLWNQIEKKPLEYCHRFFPTKLVVRETCGFYLKKTKEKDKKR